jgi:hypothetical protein
VNGIGMSPDGLNFVYGNGNLNDSNKIYVYTSGVITTRAYTLNNPSPAVSLIQQITISNGNNPIICYTLDPNASGGTIYVWNLSVSTTSIQLTFNSSILTDSNRGFCSCMSAGGQFIYLIKRSVGSNNANHIVYKYTPAASSNNGVCTALTLPSLDTSYDFDQNNIVCDQKSTVQYIAVSISKGSGNNQIFAYSTDQGANYSYYSSSTHDACHEVRLSPDGTVAVAFCNGGNIFVVYNYFSSPSERRVLWGGATNQISFTTFWYGYQFSITQNSGVYYLITKYVTNDTVYRFNLTFASLPSNGNNLLTTFGTLIIDPLNKFRCTTNSSTENGYGGDQPALLASSTGYAMFAVDGNKTGGTYIPIVYNYDVPQASGL